MSDKNTDIQIGLEGFIEEESTATKKTSRRRGSDHGQAVRNMVIYGKYRQSNDLIQKSREELTLLQQNVLTYMMCKINPYYDTSFSYHDLYLKDFCTLHKMPVNGRSYEYIREAIEGLRKEDTHCYIRQEDGGIRAFDWIDKAIYYEQEGRYSIKLDDAMAPYLLQQTEGHFTEMPYVSGLRFAHKHSLKLYRLLCSIHYNKNIPREATFSIEDLKWRLAVEARYKDFNAFNERVLKPSVKEINAYTEKHISYEPIRSGRRVVTHIKFIVATKETMDLLNARGKVETELFGLPVSDSVFFGKESVSVPTDSDEPNTEGQESGTDA